MRHVRGGAVGRTVGAGLGGGERPVQALHALVDQRVRQRVLALEVEVDARRRAAHGARDLAHRQPGIAFADEEDTRLVEDGPAQ